MAAPTRPAGGDAGGDRGGEPGGEGLQVQRLRTWQRSALAAYRSQPHRDFLLSATPGSGKTTFALVLARMLVTERIVDRIVVVCPTDHLRSQWADAADAAGLPLDGALSNAVGPVRPGLRGYVTTYAQVAAKPALHAARTSAKRTLVVLDEVHHAGDGLSWGEAVTEAFDTAARRLCMTGTPFRTRADERIPFVRYTEGGADGLLQSTADFSYGYRDALSDGVVRPVVFAAYTGTARWRNSAGDVIAASLSEPSTRRTEATAWRTALNPRGRWVPHVIAAMDERISHLRHTGIGDAAGLVLASDQDDARAYAAVVERITGEMPVLILSDDPHASAKIGQFARGTQRIAVCVRMVSEGVDIPRAACLAWMTSYRTPLFFAQGVGRVVRSRAPGETATVFLPAVRPLLALAAELENERNHVLAAPSEQGTDLLDVVALEPVGTPADSAELVDADAEFAHVLHGGRAVLAPVPGHHDGGAHGAEDDSDFLGLPGILTPEQTAQLLARRDSAARRRAAGGGAGSAGPNLPSGAGAAGPDIAAPAPWRAAAQLRAEVTRLVRVLAARTGAPHAQLHADLRRAVPGPASAAAGAEVLEQRRDHLMALLGG